MGPNVCYSMSFKWKAYVASRMDENIAHDV